ncbi:PEP/pyruvate-binding domain-containing protein [Actinokineospora sp. HUAS TT18]|uniref:PEP/pyruvate-binding domain-containing protein n=1 Tax=Actinokineospora sp. HUAS TT18 TaxID=3447451 RepID=UPI003F51C5C0
MTAVDTAAFTAGLGCGAPLLNPVAGGKGAALDRLARLGFAVPPTAIVTAAAYRAVAEHPDLAALLAQLADPRAVVPAEVVDEAFLAVPVPDAVARSIVEAARELGGPVAVRSSATVEDTAAASFAGQYRSTLDVAGDDAVLRAVRLTWASLWHPAPRAYRAMWGIGGGGIAMAVVLMRMVPARTAGVAFTVDPGGAADLVRVESVDGLGESLVSGERTPSVWLVSRDGVHDARTPRVIQAATDLALRVERSCGAPQDVEWAQDDERLWLVQARPITVAAADRTDPCDTPADGSELTTNGIGETLPGVIAPLVWDVASVLVEEALRDVLDTLRGLPAADGSRFVRRVRGRAALDLDLLRAAARMMPGGSEAEIERQYFGGAAGGAASRTRGGLRSLPHGLRAAAVRRRSLVEAEVVIAATDEIVAAPPPLSGRPDDDLLAYRRRLIALGGRAMTVELAVAAAAVAAYQQLTEFLVPHLGDSVAASYAQRVTSGAGASTAHPATMSRSIFAGPTWAEAGLPAPGHAPRHGEAKTARRELERRLRALPGWRRVRMLTGQIVDVRMHLLRRLVDDAADGLARRERVKAAVLLLGGEVRRTHLELGGRLVAAGVLEAPTQVDLLHERELAAALRGAGPPPVEVAHRARWLGRWQGEGPLPVRFTGSPDLGVAAAPAGDELTGWAASPGRHTGRARVVTDPVDAAFAEGEVLVAAATDASWSPLFLRAGAIVVERGGPLSHAAIVARELGVPAVLNLPGATAALDGRLVTVDGDAGTVVIHPGGTR